MSPEDHEKLEKTRQIIFSLLNTDLVMVYCRKDPAAGDELKWCRAASALDWRSRKDYDLTAAHFYNVAKSCFEERKNLLTPEHAGFDTEIRWLGLPIKKAKPRPGPANEAGQRWWVLVIGDGPLRAAGYVLVARVAIKEPKELETCVQQICSIFGSGNTDVPIVFR